MSKLNANEIIFYKTPNGNVKVEVLIQNETIWLSQAKIAELFGVQRPATGEILKYRYDIDTKEIILK